MPSTIPLLKKSITPKAHMSAQAIIALSFAGIILLLTLLLMLPAASNSGQPTDPLTALFTATSAVCVTGLVVVDTATHWSLFGRIVILAGIQIGGLGVITVLAFAAMLLGQRIGLRQRTLLQESVASLHIGGVVRLMRRAVLLTVLIESIGALLLCLRFVPMFGFVRGVGYSIFHAISAYCNAGFDLMGAYSGPYTSLEAFVGDPLVNLVVMALIVAGGLGFFVYDDLIEARFRPRRMQLHTRVVLLLGAVLLIVPTALFFIFEYNHAMAGFSLKDRLLASAFSAVTPRTAGFDTLPTANLSEASSLLTIILMLTGGNPGSTAGGAKTTTMLLVVLLAGAILRREEDVHVMGRRMESSLLHRACAIVLIYMSMALAATMTICALQPEIPLKDVLIEVFSAMDTVGMTTGVTRQMNPASRLILIALMYAGRLGSLTFTLLMLHKPAPAPVRRPVGEMLIG